MGSAGVKADSGGAAQQLTRNDAPLGILGGKLTREGFHPATAKPQGDLEDSVRGRVATIGWLQTSQNAALSSSRG